MESIEVEETKVEQLRKRVGASTGETLDRQEELLKQLNEEVIDGYSFTVYWRQVDVRVRSAQSSVRQARIKCRQYRICGLRVPVVEKCCRSKPAVRVHNTLSPTLCISSLGYVLMMIRRSSGRGSQANFVRLAGGQASAISS